MRGLLLVVILVLIALVLWSLRGGSRRQPRPGPARLAHDRLVKDPVCQTYVVSGRAVQRAVGGDVQYFCSQECAERYGGSGGDRDRTGEQHV